MRVGREESRMARRETRACLTLLAAVLIALGTSFQAQAGPVTLTPTTVSCGTDPCPWLPVLVLQGTDQSDAIIIDTIMAKYAGLADLLLYKATQGGGAEEGLFAAYYSTLFGDPTLPDADATISWDAGPNGLYIHDAPVFALIKDGKLPKTPGVPTWYFYDLTGWSGQEAIDFSGFFEGNQDKISHVAIYGMDPPQVPDGGSMAILLGIGLMGLAGFRRFLK
jgi:hypothetical protein